MNHVLLYTTRILLKSTRKKSDQIPKYNTQSRNTRRELDASTEESID
jgi:hypothetical protein